MVHLTLKLPGGGGRGWHPKQPSPNSFFAFTRKNLPKIPTLNCLLFPYFLVADGYVKESSKYTQIQIKFRP